MAHADQVFAGSIPALYDTRMVPMIFEPYAEDLARRVAALAPAALLETAAGTGVVTRALAPRLGADARYVVTDLNPPMLEHAAQRQGPDARIHWQPADALHLPFADADFDAVCCQFGAMFFPDRVAGYAEARRVLRPGGCFLFSVWDRLDTNDFAAAVTEALAERFPADPPRFLARTPHGYHDTAQIREELQRAGFRTISIDTVAAMSPAPSAHDAAFAYCQGTPLRNEIEARDPGGLARATAHAAEAIARRHGDAGFAGTPVSGRIQAHVVVAQA